jgi:hypothetical protein
MIAPTSPPKRLPFLPLQLITTTLHVSEPPTRGVNSHTNGNVSQRAIAWLKNVQESNNAGARRRDQPKPVARPLKRLGGGTRSNNRCRRCATSGGGKRVHNTGSRYDDKREEKGTSCITILFTNRNSNGKNDEHDKGHDLSFIILVLYSIGY